MRTLAIALLALSPMLAGCAAAVVGGIAVGATMAHDRRSTSTIVNDVEIEGDVLLALRRAKVINRNTNISVASFNGVVLLVGQVDSQRTADEAGTIANQVSNVRHLVNELEQAETASFGTSSNDAYLTAKAKSSISGIRDMPGFDASRVKIIAARRTIYLMGLVTRDEGQVASERVRRVRGVNKVVKVFEYTD